MSLRYLPADPFNDNLVLAFPQGFALEHSPMINYSAAHPYVILSIASAIVTFLFNNIVTALVGSLPAPTKDSTAKYVYWFKVLNTVIGNLQRAKSTKIEDSPNFIPAVENYLNELERKKQRIATGVAE